MRIIVMGCGRVGATLAAQFAVEGHNVAVIDRNPKAQALLPRNFSGQFVVGNGYNRVCWSAPASDRRTRSSR